MPQYFKTVEISKATNAAGITYMIASANRMFHIDYPYSYASGSLNNCPAVPAPCFPGNTRACNLISCGYLANQDWGKGNYLYSAVSSGAGGTAASSIRAAPCSGVYCNWGYTVSNAGVCFPVGGAPACPAF